MQKELPGQIKNRKLCACFDCDDPHKLLCVVFLNDQPLLLRLKTETTQRDEDPQAESLAQAKTVIRSAFENGV